MAIMDFISVHHTDVGIKKKTNEDSLLVMEAECSIGKIVLAVIADGMGGLALGEVASAVVCCAFRDWFKNSAPALLAKPNRAEAVRTSWDKLVRNCNHRILDYSDTHHVSLGTTVVALLLVCGEYYAVSVGDSRAYLLADSLYQLTKDHTVVQREVDLGMLEPTAAEVDSRRNVLLQCVGANGVIEPEFYSGALAPDTVFLLCSDGFRHKIKPSEIWDHLNPQMATTAQHLTNNLVYLSDLNKHRREDDNISSVAIRVSA